MSSRSFREVDAGPRHDSGVDVAAAAAAPGVVAVLTAADLDLPARVGFHMMVPDVFARPPLAVGRVRFVGEPVAQSGATRRRRVDEIRQSSQPGLLRSGGPDGSVTLPNLAQQGKGG